MLGFKPRRSATHSWFLESGGRAKPGTKVLTFVLTVVMAFSSMSDGMTPLAQAIAATTTQSATTGAATTGTSTSGSAAESPAATSPTSPAAESPTATSSTSPAASSVESPSSPDATSSPTESASSGAASAAQSHVALFGNLPVYLTFTLDGASAAPVAVTLQLQSRTSAWDAATSAWGTATAWADAADATAGTATKVELAADKIKALATDAAAYTYEKLPVQTVTTAGAYESRTEYRVVATTVDGATLGSATTDATTGVMTFSASAADTAAKTASYAVAVSQDAALLASADDSGADAATLAEKNGVKGSSITVAATTVVASTAAPTHSMLSPMATGNHTVTFMANGSKVEALTETVSNGGVATKPTDAQIQQYRQYFSVGALLFNNGVDNPGVWLTADGSVYDFSAPVTSDITLYAKYAQIGTYVVNNTSQNSTDGDAVTYTLSKDASVSVAGGSYVPYAAGAPVSVPANGKMDIVFSSTSNDLTVTFVNSATCVAIGATTATFPVEKNTVYFTSEFALDNVNLNKQWFDGAATTKPALDLSLQYSADGTTWTTITDENKATVGLQTVPTVPAANETLSNASVSVYSFAKSLFGYTTTDGKAITYRLVENLVPSGYVSSYTADGTTLQNTKLNPFTATVKWADAGDKYTTRLGIDAWLANVTCTKVSALAGTSSTLALSRTDTTAEGYIKVTDNGDGTWTISMPNVLGYDENNYPYTYYLSEPTSFTPASATEVTAGTVYDPTYLNEGNYASITNALYTGGTLTNTLSDTSTFTAAKVWKDDGSAMTIASRPKATLTLYRYPDDGTSNYQTASPVAGVTLEMVANPTGSASTFTVQPKAGSASLPVYNEDGYKYVYFAKETLTGGANTYKQVFVNNGGAAGNDKFLFANGELDNTITGTVDLTGTKTWVAAARQDVDAQVEMKVYQLDQDDISKSGFVATQTLAGFGTETPSKTATFTDLPKYNANGHQYIYTVMEGAVNTEVGSGFKSTETKVVDGKGYLITTDGYRYRQDQTRGTSDTTINNVLVGNAHVVIDKTFTNGLLASPTALTYTIYQNGTAIGTKTVSYTGNVDGTAFTPPAITITSYEEMDNGSYTGSGLLPRYDANGAQYKYTVAETSITPDNTYGTTTNNAMSEGTYSATDPNYAGEKYSQDTATISNYKPGEGMSITVHKSWIDAGDSMYRQPVNVELQYTADGTTWSTVAAGTIATSTDYIYIGVPKTVPDGSAGTSTYQDLYKAWITAGKPAAAAGAFRVVETSLGSTGQYAVVADGDVNTTTNPEHESGWSFVSTDGQNYDVSPTGIVSEGGYDYTITNKRVGTEKIVVNKTWVDGNNAKDSRPASITFTVTASESVFDGGTTASKNFTMTPDVNGTWTLDTGWLQKYDYTTGAFITYSIAEKSLNYAEGKTSYANQYTRTWGHAGNGLGYVVGTHHTGDIDTYALTNSLSGTVTPLMNKYWKDLGDAATIAKRPDIYPVLFRSYTDGTGTHYEKMTYQDRDWNTEVKNNNWWQCKFVAQPRYTNDGYEYTYYVGEKFSSAILNDYVCSGAYADMPGEDGSYSEFTDVAETTQKDKVTITVDGTTYAVAKLDNATGLAGTIVNKPVAQRTVSGTKTWTNLPTGFKKQYLPDVTFSMWRYLGNGTQTQDKAVQVTGVFTTLKTGSTTFAFDGKYDRYNVDGIPYVYIVKETSPNNMGLAYTITNATGTGLSVVNEFKNTQSYGITFTKTWSGVPEGTTSGPSATLTLVRYLTDGTGAIITGSRNSAFADSATTYGNVNQVTASYSDAVAVAGGTDKSNTITWTNLAYYGPNGNPYVYYVEESGVTAGCTVYDAAGTNKVTATTADGKTVYAVLVSGSYDTTTNSGSGTAGLTNKYGEVLGNVRVAKSWGGNYDSYNVSYKPSVTLKLWRFTYSTPPNPVQAGENVTLDGTETTPAAWQKDVTGLEIYAPNGDKYYYIATEGADSKLKLEGWTGTLTRDGAISSSIAPTGFTVTGASYEVQANAGSPATAGVINTVDSTTLKVTKAWTFGTGTSFTPSNDQLLFGAKISAVPTSIVYHFQYSTDSGITWSVLNDKRGNPIAKTISQNADGSFGTASLAGLPTHTMVGTTAKATMYRAFEYSLMYKDGTTQTRAAAPTGATDSGYIGDVAAAGSGTTATTEGTTATTNTVPVRKITITKTWSDEYNRDGVRPTSVSFDITRTGVETTSDTQTETVTLTSANQAGTDVNTWSADYYVPVYWNVDTTTKSTYTVTENTTASAAAGYTAYAGTSANPTKAVSPVSIEGGTADADTYFKNSFTHTKFTLTPEKVWSYNGTSYDGINNLPAGMSAYLPSSITFALQVSKDGTNWYDPSNTEQFGSDFNDIPNSLTTTDINATTGAITVGSWSNLPRYASDTDITNLVAYHYRVVETLASKNQVYTGTYSTSDLNAANVKADFSQSITATNTFAVASLAITKVWADTDNIYNSRPDAVKYAVEYSTDGTSWSSVPAAWLNSATATNVTFADGLVTVNKAYSSAKSYTITLGALPRYSADGTTAYAYRARETALVYGSADVTPGASESDAKPYYLYNSVTSSGTSPTFTASFTNTMATTSFSVTKKWVDSTPGIVSQVKSFRIKLQKSTNNATWTYVQNANNSDDYWTENTNGTNDVVASFTTLPKYDPNGYLYYYRAVETQITMTAEAGRETKAVVPASSTDPTSGTVGGFTYQSTTEKRATSSTITNTAVTTKVYASKTWKDSSNPHGTRPTSVTFHLLQDGTDLGTTYQKTVTDKVSEATWGPAIWTDLPKMNAAGTEYTYTVTEDTVAGYTSAVTNTGSGDFPFVFTVTNTPIPVTISKVASDGNKLAGATFTLKGTFTKGAAEETRDWTSSATDVWDLTGLLVQGNVYTLTETVPPAGYTLPATTTTYLKVDDSGQLYTGTTATSQTTAVDGNALAISDAPTKFTITKTDASGNNLSGATIRIVGTFVDAGNQTQQTAAETVIPTDGNPFSLTGRLIAGNTYRIYEYVVPDGYLGQSEFSVKMGADGKLTADNLPSGVTIGYDAISSTATITVADQPTSFTVNKYASTDTTHATPIAGAVFTLTDTTTGAKLADNTDNYQFTTTTTEASAVTGKMIASTTETTHTYKLEETTPAPGYTVTTQSPIYLRVNTAGNLSFCSTVDGAFAAVAGNALTMTDAKNQVSLTKKNADGTSSLSGATFAIAPTTSTGKFADGTSAAKTLSSDGVAQPGLLVAGTSYTVTETVPPAGYYIATAAFTVTMDNYGALAITGGTGVSVTNGASSANPGGVAAITVNDPQNSISITKTGVGNTAIAGASFELSGVNSATFAHATEPITWTSTTEAKDITGELVAGSVYRLSETSPASGYATVSDVYIKMDEGGILSKSSNGTDGWAAVGSSATTNALTVTDAQNKVTLNKVNDDTTPVALAGAQFTVTAETGKYFSDGKTTQETMLDGKTRTTADLVGQMVAGVIYTFSETTVPVGYLAVPDFSVKMGATGELTAVGDLPNGGRGKVELAYASGTSTITVSDVKSAFTLEKVSELGTKLAGTTFTVTPAEGKAFADGTTASKTILGLDATAGTWKSSETWTGQLVAGVTYTFTETTSPAAYVTMDPFTVTIGSDGTIAIGGKGANAVSVDASTVTAKNSPMTDKLVIHKIDATDGLAITSQQTYFSITVLRAGSTASVTFEQPTDKNGDLIITNMAKGTWTITEKTADPSYTSGGFSCTFTVTDACQGETLTINTDGYTNNAALFGLSITADSAHMTASGLQNVRQTGTVNIEKLGADGNALAGATFEVHKADGTLVGTAGTTDASGKLSFAGLAWDTYYLVETSVPAGYKVDSTHREFTIGYGNLTKNFTDASAISNSKNSFTLSKNVAGATFEVSGVFSDATTTRTITARSTTWVGFLVGGNTYTVTETVPPAGYATVPQFKVKMGTDGKLTFDGAHAGVALDSAATTVTVTDPQNTFKLTKEGENSQSLNGTKFELRTYDKASAVVGSWTLANGETSHDFTGLMVADTVYALIETVPAPGYTSAATVFLKMEKDGTLKQSANGTDGWSTVTNNSLTISDALNNVNIAKFDADGTTQLDGAQFTIAGDFARTTEKSISWTSSATDAKSLTGELIAGNHYTLVETSPAPGHVLSSWTTTYADAKLDNGALQIEVDQDGQLYYQTTSSPNWAVLTGNAIAMKDTRNSVSISKADATDHTKLLAGAQFTLSGTFAGNSTAPVTWTSTDSAHVIEGQLVSGNVYKLHEDTPAPGYTVAADRYLKVDDAGTLWVSDAEDGLYAQYSNPALTVTDSLNSASISKADATDHTKLLAGATFELTGTFATNGVADAKESTITWTSTGAAPTGITDGLITGKLIAGSYYVLSETTPALGYTVAKDLLLTMDGSGTLKVYNDKTKEYDPYSNPVLTVTDVQNSVSVTKAGAMINGVEQSLAGTQFELTNNATGKTVDSWTIAASAPTDNPHTMTGLLTAGVTYKLTETFAAYGYTVASPVYLKVDNEGTLYKATSADGPWQMQSNPTLTVADTLTTASFSKVGSDGKTALEGAEFALTGYFASDVSKQSTKTWTSTNSAEAVTGQMIAGYKYTLVENSPAPGHVVSPWTETYKDAILNSNPTSPTYNDGLILMMDSAGQLWYASNDPTAVAAWAKVDGNAIAMKDVATSLSITKVDGPTGSMLAGATLTLSGVFADGSNTESLVSWTSSSTEAKVFSGELIVGNVYTLHEDTPSEGYTVADDVYLKIDEQGTLYKATSADGPWQMQANPEVTVKDYNTDISISKANADGTTMLGNAHLTLSGFFADGSGVEGSIQWTSSATGARDFTGELIAGNVYKLTEDTPPTGYASAPAVYLKVDKTGVLWTCSTQDGTFTKSSNDFVLNDAKTSFELRKVDDGSEPLTGATFKIVGAFADGTTELPLISGDAVANLTGKLVAGNTYTVIETVPPAGYKAIDPFLIAVSADGSKLDVSPAPGSTELPAGVSVSSDGTSVTVMDDPVAVTFMKTDRTTGNQLTNHKSCIFRVRSVSDGTFADGKTTQVEGYDDQITSELKGQFVVTEVMKDAQGNYKITGTSHVYSIQEVQEPGGYQIEPVAVQFIVDQYGDVHVLNGEGTIVTSAEGTPDLSFSDPTIKTSISKVDEKGAALAAAAFELSGLNGATFADGTTTKTFTSTTEAYVLDAQLVANSSYSLTETAAPAGYDQLASAIIFTVDNLGKVTLAGDAGGAAKVAADGMTIVVTNQLTPEKPAAYVTPSTVTPQTGDSTPIGLVGGLLGMGITAVAAGFATRRRRREEQSE